MPEPTSEIHPGSPPPATPGASAPATSAPAPSAPSAPEGGIISARRKFPGEDSSGTAPPSFWSDKGKIFTRLVLPLLLLVFVVGGIAYIIQNLPGKLRRGPQQNGVPESAPILRFANPALPAEVREPGHYALWDARRPQYAAELERGTKGHYDFYFDNPADTPAELGLLRSNCDCSKVQVAFLTSEQAAAVAGKIDHQSLDRLLPQDLEWALLTQDDRQEHGVAVPAGAKGLVRISWKDIRRSEGEMLNLDSRVWMRPAGGAAKTLLLRTPTFVVAPVQFDRGEIKLPELRGTNVETHFECWSATREKIELALAPGANDGAFEWQIAPLDAKELEALQKTLDAKVGLVLQSKPPGNFDLSHWTRVKTGYRVSLTVHESRNGVPVDQGSFAIRAPLLVDGEPLGTDGPLLSGSVRGEVEIGGEAEGGDITDGQIRFGSFRASQGAKAVLVLRADPKIQLEVVPAKDYPKDFAPPPYIKLGPLKEGKVAQNKKVWRLGVRLEEGVPTGSLPSTAAVLLRTRSTPPRQIRIPIIGHSDPD